MSSLVAHWSAGLGRGEDSSRVEVAAAERGKEDRVFRSGHKGMNRFLVCAEEEVLVLSS